MDKKVFCEIIDRLEVNYFKYLEKTREVSRALGGTVDFIGGEFIDDTLKILQQIYPPFIDEDGNVHCTIAYYVYELNFGRENEYINELAITHKTPDGDKQYYIKNSSELYDYLMIYNGIV
jgi:hypothetical protein